MRNYAAKTEFAIIYGKGDGMMVKRLDFGITRNGEQASKFLLTNNTGMEVEFSDFGAHILAIRVPDRMGNKRDVVLGYDTLEEYYDNDRGFGAYVGRNANRIQGACVSLEGVEYSLDINNGDNNLHSGFNRSHYQFYDAITGVSPEGRYVEFSRLSPHLEQGLPGDLKQKIRYTLTEDNKLMIDYEMQCNKTTIVNPTNHTYFNLSGHDSGDIFDHELTIYSEAFLPTDEQLIPTGEIAPVEGTPMDFRKAKPVGQDIHEAYEPLKLGLGYDHNYVFANDGALKQTAEIFSPESGIFMKTFTDLCGMQIYVGQYLDGVKGKGGCIYNQYAGICLETQFYPNACKQPDFPSSVLEAGKVFHSRTIYQFGRCM